MYAFTHTVAPYMGCAFGDLGCGVYCYAAELPIGLYAGKRWGTWVDAKANAARRRWAATSKLFAIRLLSASS